MDFRTAFGQIARRLRAENNETQERLGREARYSDRAIGMVEQGLRAPSEDLCRFYDEHYALKGVMTDLGGYARADSSGFRDWVDREQAASDIRTYEMGFVPGLLQTADYARTLIEALTPWLDTEEQVEMRLARQTVLRHAQMRAIIEQSVLERVIGAPAIQFEQLAHLLTLPSNVTVQVMPTMAGPHPGLSGPLMIVGFDKGHPLVRADGRGDGEVFDNPKDVRRVERAFDAIIAAAMSPEQSADYIAAVMEELEQCSPT